jgi:hypothetical protein
VFEEFARSAATTAKQGTAWLALARRFVELHGGAIRVQSELGEGRPSRLRYQRRWHETNPDCRDNEKNLKLVRDILQAKGFETMEAITAEDVWRW